MKLTKLQRDAIEVALDSLESSLQDVANAELQRGRVGQVYYALMHAAVKMLDERADEAANSLPIFTG